MLDLDLWLLFIFHIIQKKNIIVMMYALALLVLHK